MKEFEISKAQLLQMLERLIPDDSNVMWSYDAYHFIDQNGQKHLIPYSVDEDQHGPFVVNNGAPYRFMGLTWFTGEE